MKRREFVGLIGGAATVWPLVVSAQQDPHIKIIGVLSATPATPTLKARLEVFLQEMLQLGWSAGSNARFDIRWGEGDPDILRKQVEELVALAPNIVLVTGTSALAAVFQGVTGRRAVHPLISARFVALTPALATVRTPLGCG